MSEEEKNIEEQMTNDEQLEKVDKDIAAEEKELEAVSEELSEIDNEIEADENLEKIEESAEIELEEKVTPEVKESIQNLKEGVKEEEKIDLDLDVDEPLELNIDEDDDIDLIAEAAGEEPNQRKSSEDIGITIKTRKKPENVSDVDETQELIDELTENSQEEDSKPVVDAKELAMAKAEVSTSIFALRTTANREDQVVDFLTSNAEKKNFAVYSIIRPHGMRGYVFVEAESRDDVEQATQGVPYARGVLPNQISYSEIEHMLEQVKQDVNIKQNDIVEIISGPFKRESAKIIRVDKTKEDVVVELLEAAVPIPITLKMDTVKVIRREEVGEE